MENLDKNFEKADRYSLFNFNDDIFKSSSGLFEDENWNIPNFSGLDCPFKNFEEDDEFKLGGINFESLYEFKGIASINLVHSEGNSVHPNPENNDILSGDEEPSFMEKNIDYDKFCLRVESANHAESANKIGSLKRNTSIEENDTFACSPSCKLHLLFWLIHFFTDQIWFLMLKFSWYSQEWKCYWWRYSN